eukprot:275147-Hanusia_phi.AAC.2
MSSRSKRNGESRIRSRSKNRIRSRVKAHGAGGGGEGAGAGGQGVARAGEDSKADRRLRAVIDIVGDDDDVDDFGDNSDDGDVNSVGGGVMRMLVVVVLCELVEEERRTRSRAGEEPGATCTWIEQSGINGAGAVLPGRDEFCGGWGRRRTVFVGVGVPQETEYSGGGYIWLKGGGTLVRRGVQLMKPRVGQGEGVGWCLDRGWGSPEVISRVRNLDVMFLWLSNAGAALGGELKQRGEERKARGVGEERRGGK